MEENCPLSFHAETISVSKEKTLTGRTIVSSELEAMDGHDHAFSPDEGCITSHVTQYLELGSHRLEPRGSG